MVLFILGVVFDGLDAQEGGSKKQSEDEKKRHQLFLSNLGRPDRHGHGQAAGDQDDGIEASEAQVETLAAFCEDSGVAMAVDRVGEEHAAEKEDFGGQENPHAQGSRFLLLLHGLKMAVQFARAMHAVLLLLFKSWCGSHHAAGGGKSRALQNADRSSGVGKDEPYPEPKSNPQSSP